MQTLKTISWMFITSVTSAGVIFLSTKNLWFSVSSVLLASFVLTWLYMIHDRCWKSVGLRGVLRYALKTLTWRALSSASVCVCMVCKTGSLRGSLDAAALDAGLLTVFYLVHEIVWEADDRRQLVKSCRRFDPLARLGRLQESTVVLACLAGNKNHAFAQVALTPREVRRPHDPLNSTAAVQFFRCLPRPRELPDTRRRN